MGRGAAGRGHGAVCCEFLTEKGQDPGVREGRPSSRRQDERRASAQVAGEKRGGRERQPRGLGLVCSLCSVRVTGARVLAACLPLQTGAYSSVAGCSAASGPGPPTRTELRADSGLAAGGSLFIPLMFDLLFYLL